jgi:hypothetical protein
VATLRDLIVSWLSSPKPKPSPTPDEGFNAARPWDSRALQPSPSPSPMPQASTAPRSIPLDPYTQALALKERQEAARKLGQSVSPILELPTDILAFLLSSKSKQEKK